MKANILRAQLAVVWFLAASAFSEPPKPCPQNPYRVGDTLTFLYHSWQWDNKESLWRYGNGYITSTITSSEGQKVKFSGRDSIAPDCMPALRLTLPKCAPYIQEFTDSFDLDSICAGKAHFTFIQHPNTLREFSFGDTVSLWPQYVSDVMAFHHKTPYNHYSDPAGQSISYFNPELGLVYDSIYHGYYHDSLIRDKSRERRLNSYCDAMRCYHTILLQKKTSIQSIVISTSAKPIHRNIHSIRQSQVFDLVSQSLRDSKTRLFALSPDGSTTALSPENIRATTLEGGFVVVKREPKDVQIFHVLP